MFETKHLYSIYPEMSYMRHNHRLNKWIQLDKVWLKKDDLERLREINDSFNKKSIQ